MVTIKEKKKSGISKEPYIFTKAVEERMSRPVKKPKPMAILAKNIEGIKKLCRTQNQDWVTMIVGSEGSGKSTVGRHIAEMFDPKFNMKKQMIYSFNEEMSYIEFIKKFRNKPFKANIFDEGVTLLFSRDHQKAETKDAVKIFQMNRQLNHFNILIVPSFWGIDLDIRERRTKSLIFVFMDPRRNMQRRYAYYSRQKIVSISSNPKARFLFQTPNLFIKYFKPDFIESFPKMDKKKEKQYIKLKRDNFTSFMNDIENKHNVKKAKDKKAIEKLTGE